MAGSHPDVRECTDENKYPVACLSNETAMLKAHFDLCAKPEMNLYDEDDPGFVPCRDQANPCGILNYNHYCPTGMTEGCYINVFVDEENDFIETSELLAGDEFTIEEAASRTKEGFRLKATLPISENYGYCKYSFYHIFLTGPSANPDEF